MILFPRRFRLCIIDKNQNITTGIAGGGKGRKAVMSGTGQAVGRAFCLEPFS
jgi:hypothetical protein